MAARRRSSSRSKTLVKFEGLEEFLRHTGVARENIAHASRVFEALASSTVSATAKSDARLQGGTAALASQDISVPKPGWVQYGGQGYDFGAEFGAYQYKQFKMWRGNKDDAGYFFWPAIREFRDEDMVDLWVKEAWKVIKPMFPETGP